MMDDSYIVEEEASEDDYNSSSSEDDEIQTLIKKECGLLVIEDDFETEMDKVMTAHIAKLSERSNPGPSNSTTNNTENTEEAKKQEEINDALFYDPNMDDDDEKWVTDKRRSYIFPNKEMEISKTKAKKLPNSDAVLNCPACMSLLCLDCQRHEVYKSQYRAMFVSNCKVILSETLKYPHKKKKKKTGFEVNSEELYNPVKCSVCNTEVAVYDSEEIYHFFNVIASY